MKSAPCEHCQEKKAKRQERTVRGKKVWICDPCFAVLTRSSKTESHKKTPPALIETSKLQWAQSDSQGHIVLMLSRSEKLYEVHVLTEFRHGRDRAATRQYYLMMRPIVRVFRSIAKVEEFVRL